MPTLMKCHYEVLESARDADADVLKKQYRKMALKFHPDKNPDDQEGAKQTFQVIQQAYDVLSDPQERAWYDNHREQILRGGLGEKLEEEGIDLFQYFSSSCYSGFTDDESGFYGVYNEVFNTLAKEDLDFIDDEDSDFEIPGFGKSVDDYDDVVGPFYAYWTSYSTPRSFSWLDKYDTRQGENRFVKRKMEAENKKLRDKARKERNEAVRNLIQFVRKRDKRLVEYSKKLQEKAEMNKKKTQEFQKKQREERKKLFATGGGSGGFGMSEMEDQLRQLEGEYTDSEAESDEEMGGDEEEELGEELDDLYCVACDKVFRTVGAKENHETSKKHKDNLEKLIEEMNEEEEIEETNEEEEMNEEDELEELNEGEESDGNEETNVKELGEIPKEITDEEVLLVDKKLDECEEVIDINKGSEDDSRKFESKSKSKKEKKKQKKKLPNLLVESDSDHFVENEFLKTPASSSDEGSNRKKKGKGKNKKSKKEKSPSVICSEVPTKTVIEADINELKNIRNVECENSRNDLEEKVIHKEEITIIKASYDDKSRSNDINSKSKIQDDEDSKGDLTCAQCKKSFASKNKLFNHLKSSGHAVYLTSPETKPASKSKRKNKK